jgi:hypothetical protein
MEDWIDDMSHICDLPVRSRALADKGPSGAGVQQLPAAVRNLLSETGRRGEVTMTTLAILSYLGNNNCPAADRSQDQKQMMR